MLYMKVSSCYYLYVITILLGFQPYGFYGLSPIYREVSVPQAPWAGWLPWSS